MATKKMPISQFVVQLEAALKRKDGYIMGAKGQDPKKWSKTSWWYTQYSGSQKNKAIYWRDNASRVWDCNGMAEGIYQDWSGVDINTKARYNYSGWCDPKGTGSIPTKYRVPGAAVFIHSKSSGYITHVGYLYKPVAEGKTSGDWWVIEARGVMYGVVKTKLSERGWNRWGLMTKYFDYNNSEIADIKYLGDELLENGDEGAAVKELQTALIRLGYDCGKWGADGDFGDATELALREFQKDHDTKTDGIYGPNTHAAMTKALAELDMPIENEPKQVKIVGGQCYIRTGYDKTKCEVVGVAKEGSVWSYGGTTADNGWHLINYDGQNGWVSGIYGKLINE